MVKNKNPYGETKEAEAIWECLKRMYKEAKPSGDIEKILRTGEGKMPDFFCAYFLSSEREREIIEEVCKELNIKGFHKKVVENTLWMGCSPTSSKERCEKDRKDYKERLKKFLLKLNNTKE